MPLRSDAWFRGEDKQAFAHRAWMRRGLPDSAFNGKPQIAICNTWSDLTPCNSHFREIAEHVKRGVWEAGGVPHELPVPSLGETQMRPTTMLYRDLAATVVEEFLRANPVDGAVLLGGCDKTIPALVMGAASVDLPALVVAGGPMLNGHFRGERLGCGTGVWRLSEEHRAGLLDDVQLRAAESAMIRSRGHCNTMGTASTMACVAEALGLTLPGNAGIPAADSRLLELAHAAGQHMVAMVREGMTVSTILDRSSFLNAVAVLSAIGGSTNAVVHLLAIANRMGIPFSLADFDRGADQVPLLVNVQPAGDALMEDFYRAGGLGAVLAEISGVLLDARTVAGVSIRELVPAAGSADHEVIRPISNPLREHGGLAVLTGSLSPRGAIIKPFAATPELLQHTGRAVVFDGIDDFNARIDDPDLDVDPASVLVLRGCGPRGYPGMPEVANMPLPRKLLAAGVRDMVRVSDGRMSGTAYGTVVLHVSPESAMGDGPLSRVRTGDPITLDLDRRRLDLGVPAAELRTRAPVMAAAPVPDAGWQRFYRDHVDGAERGADLPSLSGRRGSAVPRPSH